MKIKKTFKELRRRDLPTEKFRKITAQISEILAKKTLVKIPVKKRDKVVIVLILRSAVAMLPAFLKHFPKALIGFVGLKRDEKTAIAKKYYENLPKITKATTIIIPDPMLATAGSFEQTLKILIKKGANPRNVYYTGFVGAFDPGFIKAAELIPQENITIFALDPMLDKNFYINPGLGDFGDRYFGYKG